MLLLHHRHHHHLLSLSHTLSLSRGPATAPFGAWGSTVADPRPSTSPRLQSLCHWIAARGVAAGRIRGAPADGVDVHG